MLLVAILEVFLLLWRQQDTPKASIFRKTFVELCLDTKGLRENNDIVDSENKKLTPIGLGFQNFQVPEGGMGIQFYFPYPNDVIKK